MSKSRILLVGIFLAAIAACSEKSSRMAKPPPVAGQAAKPGSFLAYEHTVRILLLQENVAERMEASRVACVEERFGTCSLLEYDQGGMPSTNGSIVVRIVPAGVEPLVKLAGEGGAVGYRETKAEDRADVVADIEQKQQLLEKQKAKLLEFQVRKDLPVSDVLALTRELAQIETQLDELAKATKNEQRRIETNLLTIRFNADQEKSRWGRIGDSLGEVGDQFADGVANTIEVVAYGLPMLLVALLFAFLLRWLWRRFPAKRIAP